MAFTPEQIEYNRRIQEEQKQLQQRQQAEAQVEPAVQDTPEVPVPTPPAGGDAPTPEEVALGVKDDEGNYQPTENTAEQQDRPEGLVTQLGNAIGYVAGPDLTADVLNAGAAALNMVSGGNLQGLDDAVLGSEEMQDRMVEIAESRQQRREAGEMSGVEQALDTTANALEGVASGMESGIALPFTIAARIANNDAPWSDPPETLKYSPVGETVHQITEILVPTLLTGAVAGGYGLSGFGTGAVGLNAESAIETAQQDSFEDLFLGRTLAGKFGELADGLGLDGSQLTKELIEGKTIPSQIFTAVVGHVQNLGINFGFNQVFKKIHGRMPEPTPDHQKVGKVTGKSAEDVQLELDLKNQPQYRPDAEPHEGTDIDTGVVSTEEIGGISPVAFTAEAIRKAGIGEDGLTAANREYFTNWKAITDTEGMGNALKLATSTLKKLKDNSSDIARIMERARAGGAQIKAALELDDYGTAAKLYRDNFTRGIGNNLKRPEDIPDDVFLREFSQVDEDGFAVAGLIAEELGVRMMKAAQVADNLEGIGVDFSKAVENLLDLHDKAGLFLTPMRRAKRRWSLEGTAQQRKQIRKLRDADITDALSAEPKINIDSPSRDFDAFQVKGVDGADRNTIRELWDLYKGGDSEAGQTLKAYINIVAHSDPRTVLTNVVDLTKTLTDNLKKGTSDAAKALLYAARLSRLGTQIVANVNTTLNTVGLGVGNVLSGVGPGLRGDWSEAAYGWGQFLGGMDSLADSWQATRRAYRTGESMKASPGRTDQELKNLKEKQSILTENYKNVMKRLNDTKAPASERWAASLHYWTQMAGNSPEVNFGSRMLMAADEGHLVINGGQIAKGRAFQEAVRTGTFNDKGELERLTQVHLGKIFEDAKRGGRILDEEVLQLNRKITFTDQIGAVGDELPKNLWQTPSTLVDGFFKGLDNAAKEHLAWNIVSPFTRVTYETLEAFVRYEPSGLFRSFHPRYKAILDGAYGETARLQLRSNIATGWLATSSMVAAAHAGLVTGESIENNMPKRSFIIPAPGTSQGYIAVSYGKLEPWATLIASTVDAVNGVKREVMTFGAYDKFISLMSTSIGMSLLDKNFSGQMQRVFDFLDTSRISAGGTGIAVSAAGMAGTPVPRLIDQIGDTVNPYKEISQDANAMAAFFNAFIKSNVGGVGLPHDYDEFTGKRIPKTATLGDGENYLTALTAEVLGELGWAGNVTDTNPQHPAKKKLNEVMFPPKTMRFYSEYGGVKLSSQEISDLKRGMAEYGQLSEKLQSYFTGDRFKSDIKNLSLYRKNKHKGPLGPVPAGSEAAKYLQRIHSSINAVYNAAKKDSAEATLFRDSKFIEKYRIKQLEDYRKAR